ncbi:ABC transporter permease [Luteococcus sp.]|uniref:ABC transporter permease n=1 Tax=Luteococcus sp. TaxID=1969402 RepID=UPI0034629341
MMLALRQWGAFIKRSYREQVSYRLAVVLAMVTTAVSLLQFVFMGKFIQSGNSFPGIASYGGDILAYLVSGSVFTGFVTVCISSFSSYLTSEQRIGTIESVASSPTALTRTMLYAAVTGLLGTILGSLLMLLVFGLGFGIQFHVNVPGLLMILLSLVLALFGFGLAGCGILLVTKKGDPVTWVFSTATTLLSGVMFPAAILPGWLQGASNFIPTTVALKGVRLAMLTSAAPMELWGPVKELAVWAMFSLPIGMVIFRRGLAKARRFGTLADY